MFSAWAETGVSDEGSTSVNGADCSDDVLEMSRVYFENLVAMSEDKTERFAALIEALDSEPSNDWVI